MDKLVIRGQNPLSGPITVSGAKNAALPVMAACLLVGDPVRITNVPAIKDVETMANLLRRMGVDVKETGDEVVIDASKVNGTEAPYELVRTMRASIMVLGPLLARFGRARVSMPGGCAIGTRPIDFHLKGLAAMGADISIVGGYVEAKTTGTGLRGARIALEFPSMTATENIMMAASLADGTTVISNAAREPEITNLGDILRSMGAGVEGDGSGVVTVVGRRSLSGCHHRLIPDRIEAGTWLLLSLLSGCKIPVRGAHRADLQALEAALFDAGAGIEEKAGALHVSCPGRLRATDVTTQPYPGFPTDMQAQWMVLMCHAEGTSVIRETIFENRFQHVPELVRMGADITVRGNTAVVKGVKSLKGAPIMVSDLRAGITLVLAGLAAEGETEVRRIYHLDRGYERLVAKLTAVGADIRRVPQSA